MVRTCLGCGILVAVTATALTIYFSPAIANFMNKDGLVFWLNMLALSIPFQVGLMILTGWYRARHQINIRTIYFDILPAILMLILITGVWILGKSALWIGVVHILCFALPLLFLFVKQPLWPLLSFSVLGRWDWMYGFKAMGTHLVNQPFRGLDIMLVGVFAGVEATADYALAVRFSQLLMLPKQALAQAQIPRLAKLFKDKNRPAMIQEFHALRDLAFTGAIIGVIGFILLAQPVMRLFGDYESAYFILMLLSCGALIRTGFGEIGGYIMMAGYAGWALIISALSVASMVFSMSFLIPNYGSFGAASALVITAFVSMGTMSIIVLQKDKWSILTFLSGVFLFTSCVVMTLLASQIIEPWFAVAVLAGLQIAFFYFERTALKFFKI